MKLEKRSGILLGFAATVAVALAFLGIVAATKQEGTIQTLLIVCVVLLFVLAGMYITTMLLSCESKPNFFLCDSIKGKRIRPEALNFEIVAARMDEFIAACGGARELLHGGLRDDKAFGERCVFRPLTAYTILYKMTEDDSISRAAYINADNADFAVFCRALRSVGESALVDVLEKHRDGGVKEDSFLKYLCENSKYLRSRMLSYVKHNLELFY